MKKRSTTTLQRFADGECPHERPVRSTSFQVSPPPSPLRKKKRKAASFSYGSLSSFFRRRSGNLYHHLLRIYIYIYIHFLTHARTHARRFERERVSEEGLTFLRLHRVNRGGVERRKKAASIFPPPPPFLHRIYPRGLPPFQTDLFPSRLRERAEMQRILFLTIQTGSRPRRPT